MPRINNTIKIEGEITTILITKDDDTSYLREVLIDTEDIGKITGKVKEKSSEGYVYIKERHLAHIILDHESNLTTVVDHINCNRLDNRKCNLRVVSQHENCTNKSKSKNNTGIVGIAKRSNGNYTYYRATVSDLSTKLVANNKSGVATKKYTKQFNINKLGEEEAFKQAKQWLKTKREEFGYKSEQLT